MRLRTIISFIVALFVLQMPIADRFGAGGAALAAAPAVDVCHDATPLGYLSGEDRLAAQQLDPTTVAGLALAKSRAPDPESANRDLSTGTASAIAAQRTLKEATLRTGRGRGSASVFADRAAALRGCATPQPVSTLETTLATLSAAVFSRADATIGSGYGWVDNLNQQGQVTWYYCGPAVVSEAAHTMANNGRLANPVSQWTAGSYMGTTSTAGTSVGNFVRGMNAYVGRPVAGWDYYWWVWLSYSPTSSERSTFVQNLMFDVNNGWPVGGDAWEEAYYPHLVGHPYNQTIFHYIEIGGYGSSGGTVYYADSATSVWSSVPPYSWFNMQTMITILGGRGYAW